MSRINGDPSFSGNGPGTCSAAVKGLFRLVCDGIANCEIEQAYRSSCVRGALAAQEAQECEAVVRNYVESCFGEPPMRPIDGWPAAKLVDRQRNTICSVSLVQANNANQTTFATSDHCPLATGDNRVERSRNFDLVESVLNNPPDGLNGDIKFGLLQDRVFGLGMPVRQPVLGQQTFFMGYNDLIAARNDLITMNNLNANRIPALKIDGSSLCTIVSISGSNLLHTCQTTKGGSGGALFQQGDNGSLFIVGINNGSGAAGQVSENDGIVLDN
ncbi:MAG: hypothetical protein GY761_09715 [Hyphomicrobiales bacterium]|nr:hypothetical protein [Hyphomicrobiales bacterium]